MPSVITGFGAGKVKFWRVFFKESEIGRFSLWEVGRESWVYPNWPDFTLLEIKIRGSPRVVYEIQVKMGKNRPIWNG